MGLYSTASSVMVSTKVSAVQVKDMKVRTARSPQTHEEEEEEVQHYTSLVVGVLARAQECTGALLGVRLGVDEGELSEEL
jgi:hypothetical protein